MTVCDKFVSKGWGYEHWIVNKEEYCGKLLFFKKGKRCSWHYHKLKDETFHVHKGSLMLLHSQGDNPDFAQRVVLDAGDFLEGNLFFLADGGKQVMKVMNNMGYDADLHGFV